MKIKVKNISYEKLQKIKPYHHLLPRVMSPILKKLVLQISKSDLKKVNFKYEKINMEKIGLLEPCLVLMNHSSFIDFEIAFTLLKYKRFNIVGTDDGLIGKRAIMRALGLIPTKKFLNDPVLVKDMLFCTKRLKTSILMYPEATYSFDGRAALIPESVAKCVKLLKVPVVMISTHGSFLRDPLYNNLQIRNVDVSARMECILTKEEVLSKENDEIYQTIIKYFNQNAFKEQKEKNILIKEDFRADYLNRMLYKCPHCSKDFFMEGKGITISCKSCNNTYELLENGDLKNTNGNSIYTTVYDWYDFEKKSVEEEIDSGTYKLDVDVKIYAMKNMKSLYYIGDGHLSHGISGFNLTGCDGKLNYKQDNHVSYSLYSDFYWYELGDMICVGNNEVRYYCVFKEKKDLAAKARLAVQYLYTK